MVDLIWNERWCDARIQAAITEACKDVKDLDGDIIEIGSWEGMSTVHIANLVYPETLIAIDPHADDSVEMQYFDSIDDHRDTYTVFTHNIKHGTKGNVVHQRMGWKEFFADYTGKIKFIYVDGPHDYDDVKAELETIKPLLISGAIVLGDDFYSEEVSSAFYNVLPETKVHPLSPFTGIYKES